MRHMMTFQELEMLEVLLKKAMLGISEAMGDPYTEVTLMDDLSGKARGEGDAVMFENVVDFFADKCQGLDTETEATAPEIARNMLILAEDRDYQGWELAVDNYRPLLSAYRNLQAEVEGWAKKDMNDRR